MKTDSRVEILAEIKQSDRAEVSISVNSAELWSAVDDAAIDLLAHLMGKKLSTVKWIDRERTDWDREFVNKRTRLILMIQVFRCIDLETHALQVRSIFQKRVSESIGWALLVSERWLCSRFKTAIIVRKVSVLTRPTRRAGYFWVNLSQQIARALPPSTVHGLSKFNSTNSHPKSLNYRRKLNSEKANARTISTGFTLLSSYFVRERCLVGSKKSQKYICIVYFFKSYECLFDSSLLKSFFYILCRRGRLWREKCWKKLSIWIEQHSLLRKTA